MTYLDSLISEIDRIDAQFIAIRWTGRYGDDYTTVVASGHSDDFVTDVQGVGGKVTSIASAD